MRTFAVFFGCVWVLASLHFYLRYPHYFTDPNLYAEDGDVLFRSLSAYGFFGAILKPFNGYFISGLYLLASLGMLINKIVFSGFVVTLPQSFAIISYTFFGFCCVVPFLLVPTLLSLRHAAMTAILMALLPITQYEYAIVGIIGNLKFLFPYIALVFQLYRSTLRANDWRTAFCDLIWLVCLFSNPTTIFLAPLYLLDLDSGRISLPSRKSFQHRSLKLIGLLIIALISIVFVISSYAVRVPPIPGYLANPCLAKDVISTTIGRGIIWPIFFGVYQTLNDFGAIALFVLLLIFLFARVEKPLRTVFAISILTVCASIALLVLNRTGLCELAANFAYSAPDQFFLGFNMTMVLLLGIAGSSRKGGPAIKLFSDALLCALVITRIFGSAPWSSFGSETTMLRKIYSLPGQAKKICREPELAGKTDVTITLYPMSEIKMDVKRSDLCAHIDAQ